MDERIAEFEHMKDSFFIHKSKNDRLEYCVFENMKTKEYIVFDSKDDFNTYTSIPFGGVVACTLNGYIKSNPKSVHHANYKKELQEYGGYNAPDIDERLSLYHVIYGKTLNELISYIKQRDTYKYHDKIALKCSFIREWKKYRYMIYDKVWSEYLSLSETQKADHDFNNTFTNDELKDIVENCHEEAAELSDRLHKIVCERLFIPYDKIYFVFRDEWAYGNVWFSQGEGDIFSRDLYHVLVDNAAKIPRFCPRCGLMYYSNNNKSKYCPECKKQSNDIRKENIKKNPARYLHKRVWDKINAHKDKYDRDFLNSFMNESNYYWHNISGKPSDLQKLDSYQNIDTIEKYQEWLEKKLESL